MNNTDKIVQLAHDFPKHFSQKIKRDPALLSFVCSFAGETISEQAYNAVNDANQTCTHGKTRKFKSFKEGYGFCGKTNVCACAKESVSSQVKLSKSTVSAEQQQIINQKRKSTNEKKYGVSNVGQTSYAKNKHKEVYSNRKKVQFITNKIKSTKQSRYNNENFNNAEKIKQTWDANKKRYFQNKYPDKDLTTLYDKNKLEELFKNHTVDELSSMLSVHSTTVFKWLNKFNLRSKYQSSLEQEMVLFLQSIGVTNIVQNSRKLLGNGKELDIFLPDYNIAIEMNGIYWHHDQVDTINKWSHYKKAHHCEQQGIMLLTIFSDEWENKKDIIKRMIEHKIKQTNNKVYARNTSVQAVSSTETNNFLNKYHIQGATGASIRYGLFDKNNQLVAVMTFSKLRQGVNRHRKNSDNTAELVRYASSKSVVGGASKLLAHFIKHHTEFTEILSYSNNEYGPGELYKALGFIQEKQDSLGYFYYSPKYKKRYHRYSFNKTKLVSLGFDAGKSEYEIMTESGYLRVWDCGKRCWVLSIPHG